MAREDKYPRRTARLQAVIACRLMQYTIYRPPSQFTRSHWTLNVKLWVALGDAPLLALKVILNCVPFVHHAGLPLKTPTPFSPLVNVTPGGSGPISERKGVGEPAVVTVYELGMPTLKVTWLALVKVGATAAAVLVSEKFADSEAIDAVTT